MLSVLNTFATTAFLLNVLDFVIVYYFLYQALTLIKGTQTMQVMLGLLALCFVWYATKNSLWELPTTHWIIDKFSSNLLLIVVILFQSDIRRGLANFATADLVPFRKGYADLSLIDQIARAATMISSHSFGALICIELNADLSRFAEDAYRFDGEVTKELLYSVFIPDRQNPLHDGAVIIRDKRFFAAGCILPLGRSEEIDRAMGTRHRAAFGITQDTDAIVVVVSEESGKISVTHKERFFKDLTTSQLTMILHWFLGGKTFDPAKSSDEIAEEIYKQSDPVSFKKKN